MQRELFGKRLKEARKSKNMTQEVLAEKADMGAIYLGEIERGLKMPSLGTFIRLVEALGVSADSLLRDELKSGENYVFDDLTKKLQKLTPKQRKTAADILDAYINNL